MDIFEQIKSLAGDWLKRKDANEKLTRMLEMIAEASAAVETRKSEFTGLAAQRLKLAEEARTRALKLFEENSLEDCEKFCERGLLHLQIASAHMLSEEQMKLELTFDEGSAEESIERLSNGIARLKMAVEYSNCLVSDHVKEHLLEVVRQREEALSLYADGAEEDAHRIAEGALLWLHYLGKQLELDNDKPIIQIEPIVKLSPKEMSMIKTLIENIVHCRTVLQVTHTRGYTRVERYLTAAMQNLEKAIAAYLDGDADKVARVVTTGMMEARMADELLKNTGPDEGAYEVLASELADDLTIKGKEFFRRLIILSRLVKENLDEPERALNKLDSVNFNYKKCLASMRDSDMREAARYARLAHLDLDYAKQLVVDGVIEPSYSEL
ncbi:MAG TPA: hypothetical protein PKZ32_18020 [Candidatus Melainabacteria bacterium]|nr:hypothetical protein [Candidatus Melainabacteria bacterium]